MQSISPNLLSQALRLSMEAQMIIHRTQFNANDNNHQIVNQENENILMRHNKQNHSQFMSKISEIWQQRKIMLDGQIILHTPKYNMEASNEQTSLQSPVEQQPELTVTVIENHFTFTSNFVQNQEYTETQWCGKLELAIMEIIASNLKIYQKLDLDIKHILLQIQNSVKLQTKLEEFNQDSQEHFKYEKLNFEIVNHSFKVLIQFLNQFEFYVINYFNENGLRFIQFIHFENQIQPQPIKANKRKDSQNVEKAAIRRFERLRAKTFFSKSYSGPQIIKQLSSGRDDEGASLSNLVLDAQQPLSYNDSIKRNRSCAMPQRPDLSQKIQQNPLTQQSKCSIQSDDVQYKDSINDNSRLSQFQMINSLSDQRMPQLKKSKSIKDLIIQEKSIVETLVNQRTKNDIIFPEQASLRHHNIIQNTKSLVQVRIKPLEGLNSYSLSESFNSLQKAQRDHQNEQLSRSLQVSQEKIDFQFRNKRKNSQTFVAVDDLLKKRQDHTDKLKKIQEQNILELKQKLQESKLFMNMVIHDLRSPSEAIQAGLIQAKQVIENEMNKILNVTEKTFRKQILDTQLNAQFLQPNFGMKIQPVQSGKIRETSLHQKEAFARKRSLSSNEKQEKESFKDLNSKNMLKLSKKKMHSSIPKESWFRMNQEEEVKVPYKDKFKSVMNDDGSENGESIEADSNRDFAFEQIREEINPDLQSQIEEEKEQILPYHQVSDMSKDSSFNQSSFSIGSRNEERKREEFQNCFQIEQSKENLLLDANRSISFINKQINEQKCASLRNLINQEIVQLQSQDDEVNFDEMFEDINSDQFLEHPPEDQQINSHMNQAMLDFHNQANLSVNLPREIDIKDNQNVLRANTLLSDTKKPDVSFIVKYVDKKIKLVDQGSQTTVHELKSIKQLESGIFQGIKNDQIELFMNDYSNYKAIMQALKQPMGNILKSEEAEKVVKAIKQAYAQDKELLQSCTQQKKLISKQQFDRIHNSAQKQEVSIFQDFKLAQPDKNSLGAISRIKEQQRAMLNNQDEEKDPHVLPEEVQVSPAYDQRICPRCLSISQFMLEQMNQICETINTTVMYIEQSISSSHNLTNLINDLLDLAKLEQATFQLSEKYFNMYEVISELFTIMKYQATRQNIKLLLQFDTSQPFVFQRMSGDRRRFLQIIQNFVSNSLKFTPSGGFVKIHLKIIEEQIDENQSQKMQIGILQPGLSPKMSEIKIARRASVQFLQKQQADLIQDSTDVQKYVKIRMVIEDNGVGISKENVGMLFKDYSRLQEHENMNAKGTGLGMSICKKIVTQMGGNVYAESELGKGTKINVEFGVKAIDKKYLVTHDQMSMTNDQKIHYMEKIDALNYYNKFWEVFEREQEFQPDALTSEEINQYKKKATFNMNYLRLDQKKELFVFNPLAIRNKNSSDLTNIYSQRINKISNQIIKYSLKNKIEIDHLDENLQQAKIISSASSDRKQFSRERRQRKPRLVRKRVSNNSMVDYSLLDKKKLYFGNEEEEKKQSNINENNMIHQDEHSSSEIFESANLSPNQYDESKLSSLLKQSKDLSSKQNLRQVQQWHRNLPSGLPYLHSPSMPSSHNTFETINQKMIEILCKYKVKKLRVLIANDDPFSLLILSSNLANMKCFDKIDQATNGKQAIDLVRAQEKNHGGKSLYYDFILLDLNMPICDGYEACKKIKMFYEKLYMERFLSIDDQNQGVAKNGSMSSEINRDQWLTDLKFVYQIYLDSLARNHALKDIEQGLSDTKKGMKGLDAGIIGEFNKHSEVYKQQFLKILEKLKLRALSYRKVPFTFAYTAMINEETMAQTKQAGFDDCFLSPIQTQKVDLIVSKYLMNDCDDFIQEKFNEAFSNNAYHILNMNLLNQSDQLNQENNYNESNPSYNNINQSQVLDSLESSLANKDVEEQIVGYQRVDAKMNSVISEDQNEDYVSSLAKSKIQYSREKQYFELRRSDIQSQFQVQEQLLGESLEQQIQSNVSIKSNKFVNMFCQKPNNMKDHIMFSQQNNQQKAGSPLFSKESSSDEYSI